MLCKLNLQCVGLYYRQPLLEFFVAIIVISIHNTVCLWRADRGEAALENLVYQPRSLVNLRGNQTRAATNEESQWTESSKRINEGPRWKGGQLRIMAVQNNDSSSSSSTNGPSSPTLWAQVVSQVASVPWSTTYESYSSFMYSGTYYIICYSGNHVASKCLHLVENIHLVKGQNWNYETLLKMKEDHCSQTPYTAGHYCAPPPSCQSASRTFN